MSVRSERLARARERGTHTTEEWIVLVRMCKGTCVICKGASGLRNVEKDHVIPLYQDDSSDAIANLQPICAYCNCSKGSDRTDHVSPQIRLAMLSEVFYT